MNLSQTGGPPRSRSGADRLPPATAAPDRAGSAAAVGTRVLVVDDNLAVCRLAAGISEGLGLETVVAGDQASFLQSYGEISPSIVLLDLHLPGCDGLALLNELYRQHSQAWIILISGADRRVLKSASEFGRSRGLSIAGALEKPFAVEELEALLSGLVARKEPQDLPAEGAEVAGELSCSDLAAAIADGDLFLRYQPKLALGRDGRPDRVAGVEALVRWRHPRHGEVPPARFIGLAEQSGLIGSLTDAVFRAAAGQAAQWQACGQRLQVAVNLSQALLGDTTLPDRLAQLARDAGVAPGRIMLEVTESAVSRDAVAATEVLTRFRLNGFGLSIDDFGTGHSSLVELYKMPFNELKIDRTFVSQVEQQEEARVIVRTLVRMAHELGLRTVGEGVETQAMLDFLRGCGCDEAQGYVVSRPVLPEAVAGIVARHDARHVGGRATVSPAGGR